MVNRTSYAASLIDFSSHKTRRGQLDHLDIAVTQGQIYQAIRYLSSNDIRQPIASSTSQASDRIFTKLKNLNLNKIRVVRNDLEKNVTVFKRTIQKPENIAFLLPGIMCISANAPIGIQKLPIILATNLLQEFECDQLLGCIKLPEIIYDYTSRVKYTRNLLPRLSDTSIFLSFSRLAAAEQLIFGYGLQTLLLKKLPERILGKKLVNNRVAACARVAITASMYALAHATRPEYEAKYGFSSCSLSSTIGYHFLQGLIYSGIQELTQSTMAATAYRIYDTIPSVVALYQNS